MTKTYGSFNIPGNYQKLIITPLNKTNIKCFPSSGWSLSMFLPTASATANIAITLLSAETAPGSD